MIELQLFEMVCGGLTWIVSCSLLTPMEVANFCFIPCGFKRGSSHADHHAGLMLSKFLPDILMCAIREPCTCITAGSNDADQDGDTESGLLQNMLERISDGEI